VSVPLCGSRMRWGSFKIFFRNGVGDELMVSAAEVGESRYEEGDDCTTGIKRVARWFSQSALPPSGVHT